MPDYSPEKLQAFAIRRFQSVTNEETVGQTYVAIFGEDPEAESLGKKLMKRSTVKSTVDEMMQRVKNFAVANVGSIALMENNLKEALSQAIVASPDQASMDNPLCDVKVLKDGTKIPVFPDKATIWNLAARATKMVGADTNVQINLPSWESNYVEGQRSWSLPEEVSPQLTENSAG